MNAVHVFSFTGSQAVGLPPHLLAESLFWKRELGEKKADSCRQTAQWCCCFLLHDGLAFIAGRSGKADRLKGDIWYGFLFWFPQTFLSVSELGGIQAQTQRPGRRRHAIWLQVIISTQSRVTHLWHRLLSLSSWLPLQPVCMPRQHFNVFIHFFFNCSLFGLWLSFHFLFLLSSTVHKWPFKEIVWHIGNTIFVDWG